MRKMLPMLAYESLDNHKVQDHLFYELSSLSLMRCHPYLLMSWHLSVHEVITSMYYISTSLDEYIVEMAKAFSTSACVVPAFSIT
jgi:hypothetical protein